MGRSALDPPDGPLVVPAIGSDQATIAVPGGMDVGLSNWVLWAALAFALTVAFLVTPRSTGG